METFLIVLPATYLHDKIYTSPNFLLAKICKKISKNAPVQPQHLTVLIP